MEETLGGATNHYKIPKRAAPLLMRTKQSSRSQHNSPLQQKNNRQVKKQLIMAIADATDSIINQASQVSLINCSTAPRWHQLECTMIKRPKKSSSFDDYFDLMKMRKSCKKLMQDLYANHQPHQSQSVNEISKERPCNNANQDSIDRDTKTNNIITPTMRYDTDSVAQNHELTKQRFFEKLAARERGINQPVHDNQQRPDNLIVPNSSCPKLLHLANSSKDIDRVMEPSEQELLIKAYQSILVKRGLHPLMSHHEQMMERSIASLGDNHKQVTNEEFTNAVMSTSLSGRRQLIASSTNSKNKKNKSLAASSISISSSSGSSLFSSEEQEDDDEASFHHNYINCHPSLRACVQLNCQPESTKSTDTNKLKLMHVRSQSKSETTIVSINCQEDGEREKEEKEKLIDINSPVEDNILLEEKSKQLSSKLRREKHMKIFDHHNEFNKKSTSNDDGRDDGNQDKVALNCSMKKFRSSLMQNFDSDMSTAGEKTTSRADLVLSTDNNHDRLINIAITTTVNNESTPSTSSPRITSNGLVSNHNMDKKDHGDDAPLAITNLSKDDDDYIADMSSIIYTFAKPMHVDYEDYSEIDAHHKSNIDITSVDVEQHHQQQTTSELVKVREMKDGTVTKSNSIQQQKIELQQKQLKITENRIELLENIQHQNQHVGEDVMVIDQQYLLVENPTVSLLNEMRVINNGRDSDDKSSHHHLSLESSRVVVADNNNSRCPSCYDKVIASNDKYIKLPPTVDLLCDKTTTNNSYRNDSSSDKHSLNNNRTTNSKSADNHIQPMVNSNVYYNILTEDVKKVESIKTTKIAGNKQTANLDNLLQMAATNYNDHDIVSQVVSEQGNSSDKLNEDYKNDTINVNMSSDSNGSCSNLLRQSHSNNNNLSNKQKIDSQGGNKQRVCLPKMNNIDLLNRSASYSLKPSSWLINVNQGAVENQSKRPDALLSIDIAEHPNEEISSRSSKHLLPPSSSSSSSNGLGANCGAGERGGASSTSSSGTSGLGPSASVSNNSNSEDSSSENIKLTLSSPSSSSPRNHNDNTHNDNISQPANADNNNDIKSTDMNHCHLPLEPDQIYPPAESSTNESNLEEPRRLQQVYATVSKQSKSFSSKPISCEVDKFEQKTTNQIAHHYHLNQIVQSESKMMNNSDDKSKKYQSDMALSVIGSSSKKNHHFSSHELHVEAKTRNDNAQPYHKSLLKKFGKLVSRAFTSSDNSNNTDKIIARQENHHNKNVVVDNKNTTTNDHSNKNNNNNNNNGDNDNDQDHDTPPLVFKKNSVARKSFISRFIIQKSSTNVTGQNVKWNKTRSSFNRKGLKFGSSRTSRPSLTGHTSGEGADCVKAENNQISTELQQVSNGANNKHSLKLRTLATPSRVGSYRRGSHSKRGSKRRASLEAALAANGNGRRSSLAKNNQSNTKNNDKCEEQNGQQNVDLIILPSNSGNLVTNNRLYNSTRRQQLQKNQQTTANCSSEANNVQCKLSSKLHQRSQQQIKDDLIKLSTPINGCDRGDLVMVSPPIDEESIYGSRINAEFKSSHHGTNKSGTDSTSSTFLQNVKQRMSFRRIKSTQPKITGATEKIQKQQDLIVDDKDLRVIVTNSHNDRHAHRSNSGRSRAQERAIIPSATNITDEKLKASHSLGKKNGSHQAEQLASLIDTQHQRQSNSLGTSNHKSLLSHVKALTRSNTNLANAIVTISPTGQTLASIDTTNKDNKNKNKSTTKGVRGRLVKISKSEGTNIIELCRSSGTPWGFFIATGTLNNVKGIYISRIYNDQATESLSGLISPGDRIMAINDKSIEHQPDYPISEVNKQIGKNDRILLKLKPYNKEP